MEADRRGQVWRVDEEIILVVGPPTRAIIEPGYDHPCLSLTVGDVTDRVEWEKDNGWESVPWMERIV